MALYRELHYRRGRHDRLVSYRRRLYASAARRSRLHVFRSSFNFIPDRFHAGGGLFGREHVIDDMLSANYGFWDMVAGTEYNEDGFYEFFSLKNLRIACTWTVAIGLAVLFSYPDLWEGFVAVAEQGTRLALGPDCLSRGEHPAYLAVRSPARPAFSARPDHPVRTPGG